MPMTGNIDRVEILRRCSGDGWSAEEKVRIVQETYAPGMSVSLVARQHGVEPNRVHLAAPPRRGSAVGDRRRRGSGGRLRIPGIAASGSRTAATVRQEDPRERDPARGARSGAAKKTAVRPLERARRQGDLRYARCGTVQSRDASGVGADPKVTGASATARGNACHRDQDANRRSAHLWLSPHPCLARWRAPVNVKRVLPDREGVWSPARPPYRERRGTGGMMAGLQSSGPIRGGARTGSRSAATTARKSASPLR